MAVGAVRVEGLRELNQAFGRYHKQLQKELREELKKVAEPVAADAREKASRFGPKTTRGIAAGTRAGAAVVRQRNRKTTGHHPEFGALQMRTALEPALEENTDEVLERVETMLDRLGYMNGF